jgi:hypothetical protein
MTIASKVRPGFGIALLLFSAASFSGYDALRGQNLCDMTPDGSVWLTVARLVWAEKKFHGLHGRYGALVEMTNLIEGLSPEVTTTGRMGSYSITIELTKAGYILRANANPRQGRRALASFYGDQTELITFDRFGRPAGPDSEKMSRE